MKSAQSVVKNDDALGVASIRGQPNVRSHDEERNPSHIYDLVIHCSEGDVESANAAVLLSSSVPVQKIHEATKSAHGVTSNIIISSNTTAISNDDDEESTANMSALDYTCSAIDGVKYIASMALLAFSVIIVTAATFARQTVVTNQTNVHPILACVIFWTLVLWLAMMEGGQGALVGLQSVDPQMYRTSHPRTFRTTALVYRDDNLARFIVGRQFVVVLIVFGLQLLTTPISGARVLQNPTITNLFLHSGVAVLIITITLGQLTAQVNTAATCFLDASNNHVLWLTTHISLLIEQLGLFHAVYIVPNALAWAFRSTKQKEEDSTVKGVATTEQRRTTLQMVWFGARAVFSCSVLIFALTITLAALWTNRTASYQGISATVSTILLFILLTFMGLLEGMQIALFSVINMPDISEHLRAYANYQTAFRGQNLQAFLIGRQMCVTTCIFIIARIATINVEVWAEDSDNLFGVSDGMQRFFDTGMFGAVVTTIVGSLAWRMVAASFPVAFLANPLIHWILRVCLLLETSGICSSAWVMARFNQHVVKFQADVFYLRGTSLRKTTRRDRNIEVTVTWVVCICSMALLMFSVAVIMAAVFTKQTKVAAQVHPVVAFGILWILILWLAVMEGGQGCLVGLKPVAKDRYYDTHPIAHMVTTLVHKGDNMERFIVGRQFLVVLVVFVANMCGSPQPSTSVLGLPQEMTELFLGSGVAMSLMTIMLGQLTAQVNAAECMLDFINNYCMLLTSYLSMAIEWTGLLHSVYLVQVLVMAVAGKPSPSSEQRPVRRILQSLFFWARVMLSLAVLGFSFTVTLKALFQGKTTMYDGVPNAASVVIFFSLMCFVGLMEGTQIALFSLVRLPREEIARFPMAAKVCALTFTSQNLQAFLIGRQICVTLCTFVIARITSLHATEGEENLLGVPDAVQAFFNTGLLGAVITTIVASLVWRIIASSFPLAFLSNPLVYIILRLCLVVEASGVCAAARLLASIHKRLAGYQSDEVYIGS